MTTKDWVKEFLEYNEGAEDIGSLSDKYHTYDELYYNRMVLFAVVCNTYKSKAWKSWQHHDGSMFHDYFIVGVETPEGQFSFHYHKDFWDKFKVVQLMYAPEWDGHVTSDITRLLSLVGASQ